MRLSLISVTGWPTAPQALATSRAAHHIVRGQAGAAMLPSSSGLRQASRSFISSSSSRSHLTAVSTRSRSVGAAGQIKEFDSPTSCSKGPQADHREFPNFNSNAAQRARNLLNRSFLLRSPSCPTCTPFAHKQGAAQRATLSGCTHVGPNQTVCPNLRHGRIQI